MTGDVCLDVLVQVLHKGKSVPRTGVSELDHTGILYEMDTCTAVGPCSTGTICIYFCRGDKYRENVQERQS